MRPAAWLVAVGVVALAACTSTAADEASCTRADQATLDVVATKLTADGALRNASLHTVGGLTFVTAELHENGDRADKEGKLLTWATEDPASGDWLAVDVYARDESSWPDAPFDVRRDGVIESRACAARWVGDETEDATS